MTAQPDEAFYLLKRQVETFPEFKNLPRLSDDEARWLGLTGALVERFGSLSDRSEWGAATFSMNGIRPDRDVGRLRVCLYRLLSAAELRSPETVRDAFIPAGTPFDAFAAIKGVLGRAKASIYFVDPYLNSVVLTDFVPGIDPQLRVRLIGSERHSQSDLQPGIDRWRAQGKAPAIEARVLPNAALHDRWLIIDEAEAWVVSQSFKDFAKTKPGSLTKADPDSAALKCEHVAELWAAGARL